MESEKLKNIYLPCVKSLLDTWGIKTEAGCWDMDLQFDYHNNSVEEYNCWYATVVEGTLEAFSSLIRVNRIRIKTISSAKNESKGTIAEWQTDKLYEEYLDNVFKTIKEYPTEIESISMNVDFFVYFRTEKSYPEPIRAWIREFGQSINIGVFEIYLSLDEHEPGAIFFIDNTLFYPFSYPEGEDNTELFSLNRPLLEEALKNWEQKFNAEIEADGLPGIYKYGFLPEDQW